MLPDLDYITVQPPTSGFTISQPEPSGWKCELFGMNNAITVRPVKGNVPNAFWRWMQYICFGNKWTKE